MPPVTKVEDQNTLVPTTEFPYAKWKFEKFNPVQSRVIDFYDKETNGLIAAATSSGKTVVAEQFISQEIRKRGGKGLYLVPLRALAREKANEWTNPNYHFGDLKVSICTGDFRLTKERAKELAEADLIVMTSEMLSARCRNYSSEQNEFLKDIGTLVIDESHKLGDAGRGDHLEVGLMKFTAMNPNCRLILLSATMPNVEEIADWVSYSLTKKDTFVLKSKFRPVPLTVHYESYFDGNKMYDRNEEEKVRSAMEIVEWYPDDKFLIFAHTKRTGELMTQALINAGIQAEFHNADLENNKRAKLEDNFRNDPKLRVIVATSTLEAGLNMPARRVIVLGVHRGLTLIEAINCIQMCGRAGRLGLDAIGDAYILLPESNMGELRTKVSTPARIESQLLARFGEKYKTLAFHLVSEIHHGDVKTVEDVHTWYKRSLAYFQNKSLEALIVDQTVDSLKKCGAITLENDELITRPIGKVASMFYFSPFDVSDLYFNFKNLFDQNKQDDDYMLSIALSNIDTHKVGIVSKIEKDEISLYSNRARTLSGKPLTDSACKAGYCYFNLLNGVNAQSCGSFQRNLSFDYNRLSQVLQALDSFGGMWGKSNWFNNLESRIVNGIPAYLADIYRIANIGKVRATKLYNAGYKSVQDIADADPEKIKKLLNVKKELLDQIIKDAEVLSLV